MADGNKEKGYMIVEGAIPPIKPELSKKEIEEIEKEQREKDNKELRDVINNKK